MNLSHHEVQQDTRKRRHYRLLLLGMSGILIAIVFFSFWIGYYPLSPSQVMTAFLSRFGYQGEILPQAVTIFWNIRPVYRRLPVRCRFYLSGNVPKPSCFSGHSGRLLRSQPGSRFCNFKRRSRLGHSAGRFFRRCRCCCRFLSDQPEIHVFPYADPGSHRLYDHVPLQRRSDHDQVYCRSQRRASADHLLAYGKPYQNKHEGLSVELSPHAGRTVLYFSVPLENQSSDPG